MKTTNGGLKSKIEEPLAKPPTSVGGLEFGHLRSRYYNLIKEDNRVAVSSR
jgi:hypothetical protein